jgi:hypothetical protein
MSLNVVTLRESTLLDIPAKLRELAAAIEKGEYGEVGSAVVLTYGDSFEVFGYGTGITPGDPGSSAALMCQAGALRFARAVESTGQ